MEGGKGEFLSAVKRHLHISKEMDWDMKMDGFSPH